MLKSVSNIWGWDRPALVIEKPRPTSLVKQGSWYRVYKSDPDHTYVNALFLGSDEYWGSNNNGDAFKENELVNNHHTFVEHANHFKHHQNEDPSNSYGKVCETYYNPDMHRVEGIIKIINKRSPKMIVRIERGESVPLSMACRVKYDVCSICGHESSKISEYCNHLRNSMNRIMRNGEKIRAFNPNPIFFDISEVYKGADPTAFTLKKLAGISGIQRGDNRNYSNQGSISEKCYRTQKKAILKRMAELEKRIEMSVSKGNPGVKVLSKGICAKSIDAPLKKMSKYGCVHFTFMPGRQRMYRTLLKQATNVTLDALPHKNQFIDVSPEQESLKSMSYLEKYAYKRIKRGLPRGARLECSSEPSVELMKIAFANAGVVCNNPLLLEDAIFSEMAILQNFCK